MMATLFLVAQLMGGLMTKFQRYRNMFERCKNAPVGRGGDNDDDIDAGKQANSEVESRESSVLLLEWPE